MSKLRVGDTVQVVTDEVLGHNKYEKGVVIDFVESDEHFPVLVKFKTGSMAFKLSEVEKVDEEN